MDAHKDVLEVKGTPKTMQTPAPRSPQEIRDEWQRLQSHPATCPPPPCQGCQRDPQVSFSLHGELGTFPAVHCTRCPMTWKTPEDFVSSSLPLSPIAGGFFLLLLGLIALLTRPWPDTLRWLGAFLLVGASLQLALRLSRRQRRRDALLLLLRLGQPADEMAAPWSPEQLSRWLDALPPRDPDATQLAHFIKQLKETFLPLWQLLIHARHLSEKHRITALQALASRAHLRPTERAFAQARLAWLQSLAEQPQWLLDLDDFHALLEQINDIFQARALKIPPDPETPSLQQALLQGRSLLQKLLRYAPTSP